MKVVMAGGFAVSAGPARLDGEALGRLGRLALAYLVAERHRAVPRDELAEVLWDGQPPRTWPTALRVAVSRVRAALAGAGLPAGLVATAPGGYRLRPPAGAAVEVDLEGAAAAVDGAEAELAAGHPPRAAELAAAALAVAGQPFLGGEGGRWAERRQGELRALRLRALLASADAALGTGNPGAALAAAEEAVAQEPFREAAHERVLAAHGAAGNRAEALRAYERCRRLLADELGVPPSAPVQALYERLLLDDGPSAPAGRAGPAAARPNLARSLAPFVGRAAELAEVRRLLAETRLLTLLGAGGVGKTRLALEAAPEGACLVELGGVDGAGAVALAALAATGGAEIPGLPPTAALVAHLGERTVLVVLDNCEHLAGQCAELVTAVLGSCPGAAVLATSREPLRVAGEVTWRVPSLGPVDAAALFCQRARAARPDLDCDEGSPAVAQVCRRLDGIPLALELAAARTRALPVADIAAHLDDRFHLLTGGGRDRPARHQTLRAAVDWTYQGLPAAEARLFEALSVFAGPFSLDAARQVAGADDGPGGVLAGLIGLVDRSLVQADLAGGKGRYRLLETLRHYGAERLEASGRGPAVRDRHLAWAMALAAAADAHLGGARQAGALDDLEAAHDDLRAALAWAVSVSGPAALALAGDLGRFWEVRGHLTAGRDGLAAALAAPGAGGTPARARALDRAGALAQQQGDYAEAARLVDAGLAIHRRLGHRRGVAAGLHGLGNLAALEGDLAEAGRLFAECLAIGEATGDDEVRAAALANLGTVAEHRGDLADAEAAFEASLALGRRRGDEHAVAQLTGNLGYLAHLSGDAERAGRLLEESLARRRRLGDRTGAANALANLGLVALAAGRPAEAAERLAASLALAEEVGDRRAAAVARLRLARAARAAGDLRAAVAADRAAVAPGGHLGARRTVAEWLEGLAATAAALGDPARTAALLGAAAGLRRAIGSPVPAPERSAVAALAAGARAALGEAAYGRAEATGWEPAAAGSLDDVVAFAWQAMPAVPEAGEVHGAERRRDPPDPPM